MSATGGQRTTISDVERGGQRAREGDNSPLTPGRDALGRATATVCIGHKIGWSTDFGREKADVYMEVTLPCAPDEESIAETVARARRILDADLPKELDRVVDKYFEGGPVIFGSGRSVTPP